MAIAYPKVLDERNMVMKPPEAKGFDIGVAKIPKTPGQSRALGF
jgi:hypothetical protein